MVRRESKAEEIAEATADAEPCCSVPAGDDLPVKVGGTEIGTWSSKNEATFIALASDACFKDRVVTYGENPYGDSGTLMKGRGVFPLSREPDFFLSKAPTSVGAVQGTKSDTRRELDFTECPAP